MSRGRSRLFFWNSPAAVPQVPDRRGDTLEFKYPLPKKHIKIRERLDRFNKSDLSVALGRIDAIGGARAKRVKANLLGDATGWLNHARLLLDNADLMYQKYKQIHDTEIQEAESILAVTLPGIVSKAVNAAEYTRQNPDDDAHSYRTLPPVPKPGLVATPKFNSNDLYTELPGDTMGSDGEDENEDPVYEEPYDDTYVDFGLGTRNFSLEDDIMPAELYGHGPGPDIDRPNPAYKRGPWAQILTL